MNGFVTAAFAQMWNGEMITTLGRTGSIRGALGSLAYPIAKAIGEILGNDRHYLTYILTNPDTGRVYVGRASGFGAAEDVLYRRLISHFYYMVAGYTKVKIDVVAIGDAYFAIRGREQQLVDSYGGIGNTKIANLIRPVSAYNVNGYLYWQASNDQFGQLAHYTGVF
jgi:hypothetical protein